MKSIARSENQITLIYNSENHVGERTHAHASAIKDKELQAIDIAKTPLTGTQWAELADGLNTTVKGLLSFENVSDDDELKTADFDENDYIKIIENRPELLAHPILIHDDKMKQVTNPTEAQEFLGVDSAGLEKKMMHEEPTISNTTKKEHFVDKPETGDHN
ncbi:MAG: hypothetical protein COA80_05790 [Leeuwenhoekiella sp.]|uniref:Arsenate reductase n=1 Tax=Leeuwenhoekiella nanhaiensis TaxID=1655491 RepID=A0A2G1VTX3_9FLAO|nr:ArsC/Spx/MgsR family protein [Leeuwenhoekiella nanhaiensis]PHQ30194.1 hypothetical protein CJ305_04315 [Leeuwenhoekiella nanhaiensis]PHR98197.1 MAG: hypothetical protein COA80_05790 [Leeuwenhoekiella sp.]